MTVLTRSILRLIGLVAIAGVSAGCDDSAGPDEYSSSSDSGGGHPAATHGNEREGWPEEIGFGLVPSEGGADVIQTFQPIVAHLESRLGVPVRAVSATAYNGIITDMANRNLEFAYLGPKSYVEATRRADVEALLIELNEDGTEGYYSIIVTNPTTGIETLEQARGRSFAFTDPNSTSGYLIPRLLFLRDMGLEPDEFFGEVFWSGSHGTSIRGVANGDIEVAATNDLDLGRIANKGGVQMSDFLELWRSDMIPGAPIAARRDLPPSLKEAFVQAFLAFNKNDEHLELINTAGYARTDDSKYDIVRYLMDKEAELTASAEGG